MAKPSKHNRGSTPGEDSDDWRTPLPVLRAIERHLGLIFIADMAASEENALCSVYFTEQDNTLEMPVGAIKDRILEGFPTPTVQRHGLFCNPPYKSTGLIPWLTKGAEVAKRLDIPWSFLLPASRTEQPWMHLFPAREFHLTLIKHRIAFLRPDGTPGLRPNHPSMVMTFPGANEGIFRGCFSLLNREKAVKG